MRDPERIDPLLAQLRAAWLEHPDWRLCQLIVNAAGVSDPFMVEDDELLARLAALQEGR